MHKITWARAAAWRAARHHLDRRAPEGSLLAVASRLCGLHAQVLSSAELTAWARVEGLERGAVQRALWEERTLVKTWAMRGTLHLLPSAEMPLWHAALGISPQFLRAKAWKNYFGITLAQLERITEAIGEALEGRLLTREELAAEVNRIMKSRTIGAKLAESSWGTMLRPAAFTARLCFAPSEGQRVRFTHPQTWLNTAAAKVDPQAATAGVTRRFLAAYGPATVHDLGRWWNGSAAAIARKWVAALGEELAPVEVEGTAAWMLASDVNELRAFEPARSVRLLPGFDQYVVGSSHHAERLLPGDLRRRVFRPQGWISPVLLVNGFMQGVWRHQMKGNRVEVTIEPFLKLPAWVRRAAEEEAERLAAFLGGGLELDWE